jgi:hypothetical protein
VSVAERVEEANAEVQSQRIIAKLKELVKAKEMATEEVKCAISEKLGIGGAKPDAQKADPKDQARDALRGLFKR